MLPLNKELSMEVSAYAKFVRISPKKVQPLLKGLRGKPVEEVLASLRYSQTKAGKLLYKLIASASANASNNYNLKPDNLKIKKLVADEGSRFKRYWFRSRGSADTQLKRTAHLSVVLEEAVPSLPVDQAKVINQATKAQRSEETAAPSQDKSASSASPATTEITAQAVTPEASTEPASQVEPKKQKRLDIKRIFRRTTNK